MEWCSHCGRDTQTRRESFAPGHHPGEYCNSCIACGKILSDSFSGSEQLLFEILRRYNSSGRRIRVRKSKYGVKVEKKLDSNSIHEKKDCATSSEEVKSNKTFADE